jgi:hypothetical protein
MERDAGFEVRDTGYGMRDGLLVFIMWYEFVCTRGMLLEIAPCELRRGEGS